MLTLSMVFLYTFTTNQANAAVGSQEIEVTFVLQCGAAVPGLDPVYEPTPTTFKITAPEKVATGEEFYLTNTSLL